DPARLKQIADLLSQRHIPFAIALIPDFVDEKNEHEPMGSKPDFVEAIRYMVAHGGSIVMHGWTHQLNFGRHHGISADDAEFFRMDGGAGRPLPLPGDADHYR